MSYEQWTVEQLRAACQERGIKATGKRGALIDRLETFDVAAARDGANGPHKRARDDGEGNAALLAACLDASLEVVLAALRAGPDVSCVDDKGNTPVV